MALVIAVYSAPLETFMTSSQRGRGNPWYLYQPWNGLLNSLNCPFNLSIREVEFLVTSTTLGNCIWNYFRGDKARTVARPS